jgi:hypothetical protein
MTIFLTILFFLIALIMGNSLLGIVALGIMSYHTADWAVGKYSKGKNKSEASAARF